MAGFCKVRWRPSLSVDQGLVVEEVKRKVKRVYTELESDSSGIPGFSIGFIEFYRDSDARPHPLCISF